MEACEEQVCASPDDRSHRNVACLRRPFGAVKPLRAADHGFRSRVCAPARSTRGYTRAPLRGEVRRARRRAGRLEAIHSIRIHNAMILDYT